MPANPSPDLRSRYRGCLLGLAVGDAVGTTLEFATPGTFEPINDMVGGGPFDLEPGQWTDDTSMALCLASSLVECGGFDAKDQMDRYCRWQNGGYLSSTGKCFDIGRTVNSALQHYEATGDPYAGSADPDTAGNGSIMRLAPVPMFYAHDIEAAERYAAESSRTTHGAIECVDACRLLARILVRALHGESKSDVLFADSGHPALAGQISAIARGSYRGTPVKEIRGTGYVVRSLEAALWAFDSTTSFRDAILLAANLGEDADTTAAICGQVAGAFYGKPGIPAPWLARLALREDITSLAETMYARRKLGAPGATT
ncbi:MAG: ADP-ribosylglycohydrolase family protein [Rhodanobacteraceae bacterium]|nr:MAG: ADP-ribosylglycohydrolase family protein [Rhodanobacteraceae bacterium]